MKFNGALYFQCILFSLSFVPKVVFRGKVGALLAVQDEDEVPP